MSDVRRFIRSTMDFDPVAEAEKEVGPMNTDNVGVAMGYSMAKGNMMERLMTQTKDVHSRMGFDNYCSVVSDLGYEKVYEETFQGEQPELFRVYWHPLGFLLKVESYSYSDGERHVNSANLYYNIKVDPVRKGEFWRECVSSGGFVAHPDRGDSEHIWAGYHDAREALRFTMGLLSEYEVMPKWHEAPHLWLVTYAEGKTPEAQRHQHGYFDNLNREKIDKFPAELREMLLASIK